MRMGEPVCVERKHVWSTIRLEKNKMTLRRNMKRYGVDGLRVDVVTFYKSNKLINEFRTDS